MRACINPAIHIMYDKVSFKIKSIYASGKVRSCFSMILESKNFFIQRVIQTGHRSDLLVLIENTYEIQD